MAPLKSSSLQLNYLTAHYPQDFNDAEGELIAQARRNRDHAYAPYSKFHVGAAVLLENGEIVSGSNQENAAFPSGLCAERVAVFQAGHLYPGVPISAVAISAYSTTVDIHEALFPCGACRQVMLEYENLHKKPMRLLIDGPDDVITILESAAALLPFAFNGSFLKG